MNKFILLIDKQISLYCALILHLSVTVARYLHNLKQNVDNSRLHSALVFLKTFELSRKISQLGLRFFQNYSTIFLKLNM